MVKFRSMTRRARGLLLLLGLLFFGWTLTVHFDADARPGGGQSYRSPSRSSSSSSSRSYSSPSRSSYSGSSSSSSSRSSYSGSSSSSSSSSSRSYSSSSSSGVSTVYVPTGGYRRSGCGAGGWILVLIVVGLLVYFYYSSQRKKANPERAKITADRGTAERGLSALREQDPEFDPQAFLERTRTVMTRVNDTWLAGDMTPARRVISDGVFVRFSTQLALLKSDGLRNAMADWKILGVELLSAEADPLWDTIHVKIACTARDLDVPLNLTAEQAQKKLRGKKSDEYHEVWSFIRRRGQKTKKGVPALEGRCPSCGADMPRAEIIKCEYCQALVNSGEHDWVLAEITQPEEWRAEATMDEVPGLDSLRERDAAVSRQELEDRASVVFWKWIEARSTGKPDKLARFCVKPPTDAGTAAKVALGPTAVKLRQVAVGSAELKSVQKGNSDGKHVHYDHATVEIRWSASVDGAEPEFDIHEFVLGRRPDAMSKRGMSSLDCPVCGGQLAASDAVTCSYCGEKLSGGKHEWALSAVRKGELPPDEGGYDDDGEGDDEPPSKVDTALAAAGLGLAIVGAIADASDDD
jgi:hypothetical protein